MILQKQRTLINLLIVWSCLAAGGQLSIIIFKVTVDTVHCTVKIEILPAGTEFLQQTLIF